MRKIIVAIDGYSSCGKSTVAKQLAQYAGYTYVDTGAMYRAVGLAVSRAGVVGNEQQIIALLPQIQVSFIQTPSASYPIRVQTMANTSTNDVEASVAQVLRCEQAGAELFRFTTQGTREVESLAQIAHQLREQGCTIPLVADIHFRSEVADLAATVCEKVRINPGNYAPDAQTTHDRFTHLMGICRQYHTAIRIGVNQV